MNSVHPENGHATRLTLSRDDLLPGRNFIGDWCNAKDDRRLAVTDPATDRLFATVPDSGAADAEAAVDAAQAAFPAWRAWAGPHRPSRAVVPTGPLHHGLKVEVEAVAVLGVR